MKFALKNLAIAATACLVAGTASAATVTINVGSTVYKAHSVSGGETLTLSEEALASLAAFNPQFTANGVTQLTTTQDAGGRLQSVTASAPITAIKVEDTNNELNNITSLTGLTATVAARPHIALGGSVSISDLDIDLPNHKVFATIVSSNGVGTKLHVPLWNIDSVLGSTSLDTTPDGTSTSQLVISGLQLTPEGSEALTTAWGVESVAKPLVSEISDFGSLALTILSVPAVEPQGCTVAFTTTNLSAKQFSTAVTVTNATSNSATGWKVNWNYDRQVILSSIKNAKITNRYLKNYTAQPLAANKTLGPWGITTFNFRGMASSGRPALSNLNATMGGQICTVTAQ